MSRKEFYKQRRTLKAANYHARAGQVIAGNLARGGNGQFTHGGTDAAGNGRKLDNPDDELRNIDTANLLQRMVMQESEAKPGKGGKGGGKGKKPAGGKGGKGGKQKPTPEEQAKLTQDTLEQVIGPDMTELLTMFADDPSATPNEEYGQKAIEAGLMEKDNQGNYRLTPQARIILSAAKKGDMRRAKDALSRANDQAAKRKRATQIAEIRAGKTPAKKEFLLWKPAITGAVDSNLTVFKDAQTGRWRWITLSSSAYQDRDGEYVSLKALTEDCERADQEGKYGTLRWWHLKGIDLGDCDFNAMHGPVLLESGTFRKESYAVALAQTAKELGVSIGFYHPQSEPDAEGVYHNIRRFERSILPREFASNTLTDFSVKGLSESMNLKKLLHLGTIIGEEEVDTLISQVDTKIKEADAAGTTFKAATLPLPPAVEAGIKADGAMPDPAMTADDLAGADEGAGEGGDEYVADMTVEALHQQLDQVINDTIQKALQPIMDSLTAAGATTKEVSTALKEGLGTLSATLKEVVTENKGLKARLDQLEMTVKELNGETPRSLQARRASHAAETALKENDPLKSKEAGPVDPFANISDWVMKNWSTQQSQPGGFIHGQQASQ